MALSFSTGFKNDILDNGMDSSFDSGTLEIRTGAKPASADDPPSGTVLASISIPADSFAAASGGSKAKNGTWEDSNADASGTAGHFRLKQSGDTGGSSTTDKRIDGDITTTGNGGDMTFGSLSFIANDPVIIDSFVVGL